MIKNLFKIFFIIILFNSSCSANILTINRFENLEKILTSAQKNTLILLDIDETLIVATDAVLHPENRTFIKKKISDLASEHNLTSHFLWSIIQRDHHPTLVDKEMPETIRSLHKRGIWVFACTSFPAGPWGVIRNVEQWRSKQLARLGLTLSKLETINNAPLKNLKDVCFFHGIIFAGLYDKGIVVQAFLKATVLPVERIIFVDDRISQVKSVESFAKQAGLGFLGIEYTAVATRPAPPFNARRAQLQFNALADRHKWLSDSAFP